MKKEKKRWLLRFDETLSLDASLLKDIDKIDANHPIDHIAEQDKPTLKYHHTYLTDENGIEFAPYDLTDEEWLTLLSLLNDPIEPL